MKLVHCKKDNYDIYIGRPSPWGNPWSHKSGTKAEFKTKTRKEAINNFKEWLLGNSFCDVLQDKRQYILEHITELHGKTLGCWCYPLDCHGDILIEFCKDKNNE